MKKLIFDFDGTLVDSMREWAGKMLNILNVYGIIYPADIIKIITPLGDKGTAEYFIKNFGIEASPERLMEMMDEYAIKEYSFNIPAKETVEDTLKMLKAAGYSLNVLTASPHRMLDVCLRRIGIYELFDNVWSCDDFGTTKGDVGIYHSVAKKLGSQTKDCIFLDDNINALSVARSSGMDTVGVYDESSNDMKDEISALATHYIYRMNELIYILKV